jgi:glutamate--cysteine ligase
MGSPLTLTRSWLIDDVRRRFGLSGPSTGSPRTIGAELELIPLHVETRLPVPIESPATACSVNIVRKVGQQGKWRETSGAPDPPSWELASGARISFEPGGQIEVSSATHNSASALIAELSGITCALLDAFERHGAVLETKGVDPHNPISRTPLQLHRERYKRMTQYFESIGPSGIRMMRQTASVQINVEPGDDPIARWTLLNRMAPMLVATFANSRNYAGKDSGHASYRAHLWRTLDPSRTGLRTVEPPVESYCDFALGAGWMFGGTDDGAYGSFADAIDRGAGETDWDLHLSTLFPEVRPRGYFEVRSTDMVDLPWIAAPIAVVASICYHQPTANAVSDLLAHFDSDTLINAGKCGLSHESIGAIVNDFLELAFTGGEALGADYISHDDLDILKEFVERYPANGRSPADDV